MKAITGVTYDFKGGLEFFGNRSKYMSSTDRFSSFQPFFLINRKDLRKLIKPDHKELSGPHYFNTQVFFDGYQQYLVAKNYLSEKNVPIKSFSLEDQILFSTPRLYQGMSYTDFRRVQIETDLRYKTPVFRLKSGDKQFEIHSNDLEALCEQLEGTIYDIDPDIVEYDDVSLIETAFNWITQDRKSRFSDDLLSHELPLYLGRDELGARFVHIDSSRRKFHPVHSSSYLNIIGRESIDLGVVSKSVNEIMKLVKIDNLPNMYAYFEIQAQDHLGALEEYAEIVMPGFLSVSQMSPIRLQHSYRKGRARVIDLVLVEKYLERGYSLPRVDPKNIKNQHDSWIDVLIPKYLGTVYNADLVAAYPNTIVERKLTPKNDTLELFYPTVEEFMLTRLFFKDERNQYDPPYITWMKKHVQQSILKIFTNTANGYLGSGSRYGYHFADAELAKELVLLSRANLELVADIVQEKLIAASTDGITFESNGESIEIERIINSQLYKEYPSGRIQVEVEGPFTCYYITNNNYMLLDQDTDEIKLKGGDLIGKNMSPLLRLVIEKTAEHFLHHFAQPDYLYDLIEDEYVNALGVLNNCDKKHLIEQNLATTHLVGYDLRYYESHKRPQRKRIEYEAMLYSHLRFTQGETVKVFIGKYSRDGKYTPSSKSVVLEEFSNVKPDINYYREKIEQKLMKLYTPFIPREEFLIMFKRNFQRELL